MAMEVSATDKNVKGGCFCQNLKFGWVFVCVCALGGGRCAYVSACLT